MPGHPRPSCCDTVKTWMPGTRPGMTSIAIDLRYRLLRSDLRLAVGDAINGAVPVIGDQHRAVLHLQHIDRPADVAVVLQEARDERLHGLHRAVLVQLDDDDIPAKLLGPVPRTVPGHDDGVLVALREHVSGIEP